MSTEAGSKGKGGRAPANVNNDADSIMPLLFATIGNPTISFKKMAAMDELGRTESSLEHKFRKWRQKGRDIAAEHPDHAGTLGAAGAPAAAAKKPRAQAKKGADVRGKAPAKQANVGDEEDEIDEETGVVKQEPDETGGTDGGMQASSTKGKATATNGTKKRAASEQAVAGEHDDGEAPVKKPKVVKKGTAKVVKKSKVHSGSEDEDALSEDEEQVPIKPKGKGKGSGAAAGGKAKAAAKPTGPAKAKKGKAAKTGQIPIHEDEDADVDMNAGDDHHDGMIEMQFDEAS